MASKKQLYKYLTSSDSKAHVSHEQYRSSPATAFLKYVNEAKDAIQQCINYFPAKKDGEWTQAADDSFMHITVAMLPAIMGHFETFQRYLFAGCFDLSLWIKSSDINRIIRKLQKENSFQIDPVRLGAYRGIGVESVGFVVADTLKNWHSPEKVNAYFRCFGIDRNLYNSKSIKELDVLWQLRHSIVHTGGTLTQADAQKVPELQDVGNRQVLFEYTFIKEVARKMHPILRDAVTQYGDEFKNILRKSTPKNEKEKIDLLFKVESNVRVWLRK